MDLIRKITQTAIFVQKFFHGTGQENWTGIKLIEPPNLSIWMKDAAQYARFLCRFPTCDEIQVTLIIPKRSTTFEQVTSLFRVFTKMGQGPALIFADELPSKARGVLVRMGVSHVVTNKVLYAPTLGIAYGKMVDLPEERISTETLSSVGMKLTSALLKR